MPKPNGTVVGTTDSPSDNTNREPDGDAIGIKSDPIRVSDNPEIIAGFATADPRDADGGSATDSDGSPKRRGRPRGSRNLRSSEKAKTDIVGLESILLSLHVMGAAFFATPELVLEVKEAKAISEAVANVAQHYDFGVSAKVAAWINLAMVAGGVYGTRFVAIKKRVASESESKSKPYLEASQSQQKQEAQKTNGSAAKITNPSQLYGFGGGGAE